MAEDLPDPRNWIGRTETAADTIDPTSVFRMSRTLDRDDPEPEEGDPLPPCWHWMFFAPAARPAEIGHDGHPAKGGFLPPIPYPRRMWAGSRIRFDRPLRVGDRATRHSEIADIAFKEGRTGKLGFVTVRHTYSGSDGPAIFEEQDIVYREPPAGGPNGGNVAPPPQDPPGQAEIEREVVAGPVMLFRYSALTFNGHRIHYDRPYVTGVEGYPGLIVHGPLIATLLVDLVRRNLPGADVAQFRFRGLRPTFDTGPFMVRGIREGDAFSLWSLDNGGAVAMTARLALRT